MGAGLQTCSCSNPAGLQQGHLSPQLSAELKGELPFVLLSTAIGTHPSPNDTLVRLSQQTDVCSPVHSGNRVDHPEHTITSQNLKQWRTTAKRPDASRTQSRFLTVSAAVHVQIQLSGLGVASRWGCCSEVLDASGSKISILRVELWKWVCGLTPGRWSRFCESRKAGAAASAVGLLTWGFHAVVTVPLFPLDSDKSTYTQLHLLTCSGNTCSSLIFFIPFTIEPKSLLFIFLLPSIVSIWF